MAAPRNPAEPRLAPCTPQNLTHTARPSGTRLSPGRLTRNGNAGLLKHGHVPRLWPLFKV